MACGATYAGWVDPYTTCVEDVRSAYAYLDVQSDMNASNMSLLGWSHCAQAARVDRFFANCEDRACIAIKNYGSTPDSGHEVIFNGYSGADHSFDGFSQAWPAAKPQSGGKSGLWAHDFKQRFPLGGGR